MPAYRPALGISFTDLMWSDEPSRRCHRIATAAAELDAGRNQAAVSLRREKLNVLDKSDASMAIYDMGQSAKILAQALPKSSAALRKIANRARALSVIIDAPLTAKSHEVLQKQLDGLHHFVVEASREGAQLCAVPVQPRPEYMGPMPAFPPFPREAYDDAKRRKAAEEGRLSKKSQREFDRQFKRTKRVIKRARAAGL